MKQKSRFIKSVIETSKSSAPRLPWTRDSRTPRASETRASA
ncbi:hypothetical protein [Antarcticimicrobium sediminis]|nr:hypothetical protein [Antarcticimicrobium sediminis]